MRAGDNRPATDRLASKYTRIGGLVLPLPFGWSAIPNASSREGERPRCRPHSTMSERPTWCPRYIVSCFSGHHIDTSVAAWPSHSEWRSQTRCHPELSPSRSTR